MTVIHSLAVCLKTWKVINSSFFFVIVLVTRNSLILLTKYDSLSCAGIGTSIAICRGAGEGAGDWDRPPNDLLPQTLEDILHQPLSLWSVSWKREGEAGAAGVLPDGGRSHDHVLTTPAEGRGITGGGRHEGLQVQSKRRRIGRKAMLSLQAALLSGSLLAAPWVFAAGPGDQSHDGHATPVAMPGWTQTLKGQTVVENAIEGRAGNAEKMEMQHHRLMEKLEQQAGSDAKAQQTSGAFNEMSMMHQYMGRTEAASCWRPMPQRANGLDQRRKVSR